MRSNAPQYARVRLRRKIATSRASDNWRSAFFSFTKQVNVVGYDNIGGWAFDHPFGEEDGVYQLHTNVRLCHAVGIVSSRGSFVKDEGVGQGGAICGIISV